MKNRLVKILIMGIILRVFLSLFTYHSDLAPFDFAGRVIKAGNIANFYDYLWKIPDSHPYLKVYPRNLFNYPPLPYFFLGICSILTTWIVNPTVYNNFLFIFTSTLGNPQLNLMLLLLKLPYFFFDIGVGFLLMKMFKNPKNKLLAFTLWIFNPITLYATYMVGQFDIIPTFFVLLALAGSNLFLSAAYLGLGAGFKIFPILLLIPLALIPKNWWKRLMVFASGVAVYILTSFPFILSSGFRRTALLAGQTTKSLYAQIPISGGESIMLFLAAIVFLYIVFYYKGVSINNLWKKFYLLLLVFFIFTHFHPQWLVWITPFFVIDLVKSKLNHLPVYLLILAVYVIQITLFDPGLSVWLLAPIAKNLWGLPGIWQLIGFNPDVNTLRSLTQSIFAGCCFYFIYKYFPKNENVEK